MSTVRSFLAILTFPFAIVFSSPAYAGVITGRILDAETKNRIENANITMIETGKTIASDHRGYFKFSKIDNGIYHLIASHIAYDSGDTMIVELSGESILDILLNPAPWVLNDVVVTGTRSPHLLKDVPVQTEVITSRDFQRTGARSVDEALKSSIGININEDLSGQGATIRGIESDRILVLVDGQRAVGRVRGSLDLSQFGLTNVQKIEVVKGTGSTLYGSDAMGGVINIITKKPSRGTKKILVNFDGGSFTSINSSAALEFGNTKTDITLGGKYYSTKGFDLDKETPHTDGFEEIDRWNFDAKLRQQLSQKWWITGTSRLMFETKRWIESEWKPYQFFTYDDDESNNRYDGAVSFDYLSGDKYSMNIRAFGSIYDHQWNKVYSRTGVWIDTSITVDHFYEVSYSANYVIGHSHVMTYGLDYFYQDLNSSELFDENDEVGQTDGNQVTKYDRAGDAYFQYEYSPHRRWIFLWGVRYENHKNFGSHVNPSINIMYDTRTGIKLRGFVGRGFRTPSIKQQFFVFDHSAYGYIVYGGNVPLPEGVGDDSENLKDLTEEISINSSVSAELSYGTIGLHRITYFYNHLEGLIDFIPIDTTPIYRNGIYVYQNVERSITQGIEWESRIRLSKSLDISFSYDYLFTLNLQTGYELFNKPKHTIKLYVTGFYERLGIGASFWGDYASKKLYITRESTGGDDPERAEYAPSRSTINLNLFKRFGNGLELFLRMENILDETNVDFHYWPGRSVFAGFKYGINFKQ